VKNQRFIIIGAVALSVVLLILAALQVVADPMREDRRWLKSELATIEPENLEFELSPELDYHQLESTIFDKDALWKELIPPPPPPPPPPKAPPKPPPPPNLGEKLKAHQPTRQQIGSGDSAKILFIVQGNKREYYSVGDVINGVTIKSVTPAEVLFSLTFAGKEYTLSKIRQ